MPVIRLSTCRQQTTIDAASIPTDRTFRDAWELDEVAMGEPSGIGGTYQPEGAA